MKTALTYVWQRRWCRLMLVVIALCALPLAHPFVRQSIFGPTIDGIPWCAWEDEIRYAARPESRQGPNSWFVSQMVSLRLVAAPQAMIALDVKGPVVLPVHLHLANDNDRVVRRFSLAELAHTSDRHEAEVLPVLRRHLNDDDLECRLFAACGIWRRTKDMDVKAVLLSSRDEIDAQLEVEVIGILGEMKAGDASLFDRLSKLTGHTDYRVRHEAVRSLGHFGKRAVPMIRQSLRVTPDSRQRRFAADSAARLGADGMELVPDLMSMQNDPDPFVCGRVRSALTAIDPKQFPPKANADK